MVPIQQVQARIRLTRIFTAQIHWAGGNPDAIGPLLSLIITALTEGSSGCYCLCPAWQPPLCSPGFITDYAKLAKGWRYGCQSGKLLRREGKISRRSKRYDRDNAKPIVPGRIDY